METRRLTASSVARSLALALGLVVVGVGGLGCNSAPAELDAAALDLPKVARPSAATQGAAKAFLGPFAGDVTLTAANDAAIDAAAGMPLLGDDRLHVDAGGLAVVLFTNGKVLRVEGELDQAIRDLAGFGDPPVAADLEAQLRGALSQTDRARLVASSERIGGWQLRLKALDGVAAEEADVASAPSTEPAKADDAEPARQSAGGKDEAKEESGPSPGSGELEPEESVPLGGGGGGEDGDGSSNNSPYGSKKDSDTRKDSDTEKRQPRPDASNSATPKSKSSASTSLDTGLRDEEQATKPWQLTAAKWTGGDTVTLPAKLRGSLTRCLAALKAVDATVDITVDGGTIKKLEVRGVSTLKCVEEYAGWTLTDVSGSGTIRATFKRK
jgi:hypothetical protein